MIAPTVAPEAPAPATLTPDQMAANDVIAKRDYVRMLDSCLPTLKAEHLAATFMRAFLVSAGDVAVHRARFMTAAGKIAADAGIPPMTETALQLVAASKRK